MLMLMACSCFLLALMRLSVNQPQRDCSCINLFAAKHAPVAVLPSPFPRRSFEYALELAPLWNVLVSRASRDVDFLEASLKKCVHLSSCGSTSDFVLTVLP